MEPLIDDGSILKKVFLRPFKLPKCHARSATEDGKPSCSSFQDVQHARETIRPMSKVKLAAVYVFHRFQSPREMN
jgi:hypothetical protein